MKKIIVGKRYDTDKAILVGEVSYGHQGDLERWEAGLYMTPRSKKFFLAGSGGPMTRFAKRVDQNSMSGGSDLVEMSDADALAWAEQYLTPEEIEAHFDIEDA